MQTQQKTKSQIRFWLIFFMISLIISGLTAFPVETELRWLLGFKEYLPAFIAEWLQKVYVAILETNQKYPMLAYGYDWLAFAHIVIAVAFIGPLRDPLKNIWVIEFGMISCVLIIPLAIICGEIRQIPIWWRFGDCLFGIIGIIPLWWLRKKILTLTTQ